MTLQDGRHVIPQAEESYTPDELQLMKTQDVKYLQMKMSMEANVSTHCARYFI